MRLALRTANFCMERSAGAEKEDGKGFHLKYGKVEWFASTTDFPDFHGSIGVSNSRMRPDEPGAARAGPPLRYAAVEIVMMVGWTWTRSM